MKVNGIDVIRNPREAASRLAQDEEIAVDLETGGLRFHADPVAVVTMYGQQTDTLAVIHGRGVIPREVKELLSDPAKRFTYHNGTGFDIPFLLENGVNATKPAIYDTLVGAGVVITSGRADVSKTLQAEIDRRLGVHIDKKANHSSWMNKELDAEQIIYCADDILHMHALRNTQVDKARDQGQESALKLEMAIAGAVARMTFYGLPLSVNALDSFRSHTQEFIDVTSAEMLARHGPMNVNSSDQIKKLIMGMGMKVPKMQSAIKDKETGKYKMVYKESTRHELLSAIVQRGVAGLVTQGYVQQGLISRHIEKVIGEGEFKGIDLGTKEILEQKEETKAEFTERAERILDSLHKILKLRESMKRVGMYDDAWLTKFRSAKGRIHARFRQAGTDTLRFSASEPNLQQWPKDMRSLIGGEEGMSIVSSDYSQIEVVIAAELAGDSNLLSVIAKGGDVHRWVASLALNKNPDAVTSDERRLFKAANFCLIFGGSAATFQEYALGYGAVITLREAEQIHDLYFRTFSGLKRQKEEAQALAKSGRRIIEIRLRSGGVRHLVGASLKSTTILNTNVQGNAAAGMKYAILECVKKGLHTRIGATVHDELVAVVESRWAEDYARELQACMVRGMGKVIGSPVNTEAKVSPFWS